MTKQGPEAPERLYGTVDGDRWEQETGRQLGRPRADRWQYGVRFGDGSESFRYCGRTSRARAEAEIAELEVLYPRDAARGGFTLIRRKVDYRGRPE